MGELILRPIYSCIKLNSPGQHKAAQQDIYIIYFPALSVQIFSKHCTPGNKFATFIYMFYTDAGIVLFRQNFREADRIISLYTRDHGRINLRLPSVNLAKGKLKAFSEPFTHADFRIYQRGGSALGTVTGGKLYHIFPAIRTDIKRLTVALHCCELMMRLTPLRQPSEGKYQLLLQALTELDLAAPTAAFAPAFTLRLMAAAGFGLDHPVLKISQEFWQRMHEDAFNNLHFTEPEDLLSLSKCNEVCRRFFNQYLNFPLQTLKPFTLPAQKRLSAVKENSHIYA